MILGAVLAGILVFLPRLWRRMREEKRRRRLAAQLRESLQSLVHALRIGVGFTQALDYVAKDCADPLGAHWRWLLQSLQVGKSMSQTLEELSGRVPLKEMRWFVAAVQITQTTGGSMADVLETLSATLQEQQTLREKVAALTAQGKASGVLIGAMPFLILTALYFIAPDMVVPMFTSWLGQSMLAGVLVMVGIGGLVIKKIVTIRVD
jgi:tight adherence protein B